MKIYKDIGSKDRFAEVFQKVNKVNLNEDFGLNLNPKNVLEVAYNDLKNGRLKEEENRVEVKGDQTYVVMVRTDREGNNVTFTFKVDTNEGDMEGVHEIQKVELFGFSFDSIDSEESVEMDEHGLVNFNREHENEMFDLVDEYVDVEEEEPVNTSLYEEATELIDKIPYKVGSEQMQKHKAYADEKPTNSAVRVDAEELNKFVNEDMNSILHYSQAARDAGALYPRAKSLAVSYQYVLRDTLKEIGLDIVDMYDVDNGMVWVKIINDQGEKHTLIFDPKKFNTAAKVRDAILKKMKQFNVNEDFYGDFDTEAGALSRYNTGRPVQILPASDKNSPEEDDDDSGELSQEKIQLILQAYDNLVTKNNPNYSPTHNEVMIEANRLAKEKGMKLEGIDATKSIEATYDTISDDSELKKQIILAAKTFVDEQEDWDIKKLQDPEGYKARIKQVAVAMYVDYLSISRLNEGDDSYPEGMGKEFAPDTSKYPGQKKKHKSKKIKLKEEETNDGDDQDDDGMSFEPKGDEVEQLAQDKEQVGDTLPGGLADDKSPHEFDPEQISMGIKVEMEHTDDPMTALEIAMDHLAEFPDYYTRLDAMEKEAKKEHGDGEDEGEEDDKEKTDVLLGYEPKNVGDEIDEEYDFAAAETGYSDNEAYQKYLEYEQRDFDSMSEDEKDEFFELWKEFKGAVKSPSPEAVEEEIGYEEYTGAMGDKYVDAEGNEFTVANKVKGGVTLKGDRGEKEIATSDLQFMKKLNEMGASKEDEIKQNDPATWHQIQIAKKTLRMPDEMVGVMGGMTKEEAKDVLRKHNIKQLQEMAAGKKTRTFKIGEYAVGGIIKVDIAGDEVIITALDWNTKRPIQSQQYMSGDINGIDNYLHELTSSYYAGKIMEWLKENMNVSSRPNYFSNQNW